MSSPKIMAFEACSLQQECACVHGGSLHNYSYLVHEPRKLTELNGQLQPVY